MSSNKSAKKKLIERYGEEDFLDRLGIKLFSEEVKYTSKGQYRRMKQLSYHHIRERMYGGEATVENGALLRVENHSMFHKLPREVQSELNKKFQELKKSIDEGREVPVVEVDDLNLGFEVNAYVFDTDKLKYNRSKVKKETEDIIKEYEREV